MGNPAIDGGQGLSSSVILRGGMPVLPSSVVHAQARVGVNF